MLDRFVCMLNAKHMFYLFVLPFFLPYNKASTPNNICTIFDIKTTRLKLCFCFCLHLIFFCLFIWVQFVKIMFIVWVSPMLWLHVFDFMSGIFAFELLFSSLCRGISLGGNRVIYSSKNGEKYEHFSAWGLRGWCRRICE